MSPIGAESCASVVGARGCLAFALLGALAATLAACSSTESNATRTPDASAPIGDGAIFQPPPRFVTVKLPPVWVLTTTETGWGEGGFSLDGARVCADRWRPKAKAESWDEFEILEDDDRWCATSVANQQVILEHVPEDSEVVVTVHKDGYVPMAFALMVGRGSLDFGLLPGWTVNVLMVLPADGPFPALPAGRRYVEDGLGSLAAFAFTTYDGRVSISHIGQLAGLSEATFSLEPGAGEGPYYSLDGLYDPALTQTVGRAMPDPDAYQAATLVDGTYDGLAEALGPLLHISTMATFVGLREGEYILEVHHERATCDLSGYIIAQPLNGFAERPNAIRVPVLAGHTTFLASFFCTCDASDRFHPPEYTDPLACRAALVDAGAD